MKKTIATIIFSSLFGMGAAMAVPQAQEQPTTPPAAQQQSDQSAPQHQAPDPSRQVQMLAKKLNLTQDQQNQLLPILTERQQQMQAIRNDASLSHKDRHAKMVALHQDSDSKIRAILNDNQKQAYDQLQQQMREKAAQRRAERQKDSSSSN